MHQAAEPMRIARERRAIETELRTRRRDRGRIGLQPHHLAHRVAGHDLDHDEDERGRDQQGAGQRKHPPQHPERAMMAPGDDAELRAHDQRERAEQRREPGDQRRAARTRGLRLIDPDRRHLGAVDHAADFQAVHARIGHAELGVLEQKAVDRFVGDLMLQGLQQPGALRGIGRVVERGQGRLDGRARAAEVIIVAAVNVVIERLSMGDDAEVEIMAHENLVDPLRPFEVLDAHTDAGFGELGRDDLATAPRIGRRWQFERERKAVGQASLGQQGARARRVVGVLTREVDIGRVLRREMTADGLAVTVHRAVDDGPTVERMRNRTPHREPVERRLAVVDGQNHFAFGEARLHRKARIGLELRDVLGRRKVREDIDIAGHQSCVGGRWIADEFEHHLFEPRTRPPIPVVTFEHHPIAAPPLRKPERAGADGRARIGCGGCRSEHCESGHREALQQAARAMHQHHAHRERIDDFDRAHRAEQRLLRIGRIGRAGAIEREFDGLRIEGRAVMKAHAGAQREGIGQAIGGDAPGAREARHDRSIGREAHQGFEHIAVNHFGDRGRGGRARIEDGRFELGADVDDIARLHRAGPAREHTQPSRQPAPRHAASVSKPQAASAITLAEATMSAITTYSSGWWARSRMPGP